MVVGLVCFWLLPWLVCCWLLPWLSLVLVVAVVAVGVALQILS